MPFIVETILGYDAHRRPDGNDEFIQGIGASARAEVNKAYEREVNDMFSRLREQAKMESQDAKDYERVGFRSKADRDRFVNDMSEQGVQVVYAPNKLNGQWLVEMPNKVETSKLQGELGEQASNNGLKSVTAQTILQDSYNRTGVMPDGAKKSPVQATKTTYVDDMEDNTGMLRQEIIRSLDSLGTVISKVSNFASQLEGYGTLSDDNYLTTRNRNNDGSIRLDNGYGRVQTAVVINDSMVLVGGKVVTDEATRENILARHRERVETSYINAAKGEQRQNATERKNDERRQQADKWNSELHEVKHTVRDATGVAGSVAAGAGLVGATALTGGVGLAAVAAAGVAAGKSASKVEEHHYDKHRAFRMDMQNENAQAQLRAYLEKEGFTDPPVKTHEGKDGKVDKLVYKQDGKTVVIKHEHKDPEIREARLKQIQVNSQEIQKSVYKQEYTLQGNFSVAEGFKDMKLSSDAVKYLDYLFAGNATMLSNEQADALRSFLSTGTASNLSLDERQNFVRMIEQAVKKTEKETGEKLSEKEEKLLEEIKGEIQASKYELAERDEQKDKSGELVNSLIKLDFGLAEIEAIAASLNTDFNIAKAESVIAFSTPALRASENSAFFKDVMKQGGKLRFEQEHYDVLNKLGSVEFGTGTGDALITLTTEERAVAFEALSRYKNSGVKLDDKVSENITELMSKLKLNDAEATAVANMRVVTKELGIKVSSANFDPDKVLEMQKAFLKKAEGAGMNLVKHTGVGKYEINVKLLEKLTPEHLKELGISEDAHKLMLQVSKANIGSGSTAAFMAGAGRKTISMLMKYGDEGENAIHEVQNAVNKVQKGTSYAKDMVTVLREDSIARRTKRDAKKAGKSNYGKNTGVKKRKPKKNAKKQKDKVEKQLYKVGNPEKLAKRTAKLEKSTMKAQKRALRRENSFIGKYQKAKAKVMSKFANSGVGKAVLGAKKAMSKLLIKLGAYVGGGIIVFCGAVVIIVVCVSAISSFLDAINPVNIIHNALAPDTYADTAAYHIYSDYLKVAEDDWIEDEISNFKGMYDDRSNINYGSDYQNFQEYITLNFDNLVLLDEDGNNYYSDLYINPFWKDNKPSIGGKGTSETKAGTQSITTYEGTYNKDVLIKAVPYSNYDGTQTMTFGANNNAFSKMLKDSDMEYGYSSVESGHTSNLKDILCMIDVMYGMDLEDDEGMTSLLGESPEQITFDDAVDNVKGFFKWLWNTIKAPFTDAKYEPLKSFCNDKVSYKTIVKYANTVFENSHQQEIALDVEYHKYEPLVINTDTGTKDISATVSQKSASMLGYCVNPATTKFYLKWNTTGTARVSPYFWKNGDSSTGVQYVTDTGKYDVIVDMSNYTDSHDPCLKSDMGGNEATYNYIKDQFNTWAGYGCWKQTIDREEKGSWDSTANSKNGTGYYVRVAYNQNDSDFKWIDGNIWFDSEQGAKDNVKDQLQAAYDARTIPATSYLLYSDRNKFDRTYYEKPLFEVDYTSIVAQDKIVDWHEETYYEYMYFSSYSDHGYVKWIESGKEDSSTHGELIYDVWVNDTLINSGYPTTKDEVMAAAKQYASNTGIEGTYMVSWAARSREKTRLVPDYKTFYRASGKADVLKKYLDRFERDCKGHDFTYCGGHIAVHSHGVVYSFTNEQIDLIEMWDEKSGIPLADNFDLTEQGYKDIVGKVNSAEVDYSSAYNASTTGGCKSPLFDPQGSASGMYGLNLNVESNAWTTGYKVRFSDGYHLMRDLFDIDCLVLKGDNIFPLGGEYEKYEGWSGDNMTLALLKFCSDWYEEYGFDIPQEICTGELGDANGDTITPYEYGYEGAGQAPLMTSDIDTIVDALKANYGTSLTEEREEAVRVALGYVGKGHYNSLHHHDFLAEACEGLTVSVNDGGGNVATVSYDGNCTAGDEVSFTNFIRRHFGHSAITSESNAGFSYSYSSSSKTSNALPADTVSHKSSSNALDYVIPHAKSVTVSNYTMWVLNEYTRYRSVFFVGIVKDDIELSTGQVIKAGVPIVIDLSVAADDDIQGVGNIYLHGRIGEDDFEKRSFNVYSWLVSDTSRTYVKRFTD